MATEALSRLEMIELIRLSEELKERQRRITIRNYRPYPKQRDFHAAGATFRERLFLAGNQQGKAEHVAEPVLTPAGWRPIGELRVGDEVIAGDGSVTAVTGVYPQGVQPLFRLTFDQGEHVVCTRDHLWQVTLPNHRWPYRWSHGRTEVNPLHGTQTVVDTGELIRRYVRVPRPKQRIVMPHVGTVQFPARSVPVDPYLLGVLLGDGCLRSGSISFSSVDPEIVESVRRAVAPVEVKHASRCSYRLNGGREQALRSHLEALGVYGKLAHEKFVPALYLLNAPDVRLALMQGLMDTDGSCAKNGTIEFCSTSRQLADDVAFLARSFGGKVRVTARRTAYTHNGERRSGRESYRLWIRLPQVAPFRLGRKIANLVRPVSTCDEHVLRSVEEAGAGEAVCISIAHPSKLYVTRDFIVTHNTLGAGVEFGMHLTGQYPDWWPGRRWDRPIAMWAAGQTGESTRDNPQRMLLGRIGAIGTGVIPGDLVDMSSLAMRRGTPDAVDGVRIKHASGGTSLLLFKSYDQGREKWQGETLDAVWFDEEPPPDIYSEGLTRTNATGGMAVISATPLLGMTDVIGRFYPTPTTAQRHLTQMTINEVGHYTPEKIAEIVAAYPAHERDARARGIPMLGSGRIYPVADEVVLTAPFAVPEWWPQIGGIDFGWTHPTAAVRLAWDRDNDVIYVTHVYRRAEAAPLNHAHALKAWGPVPFAWPHDGENKTAAGAGEQLSKQYTALGLDMLPERATFDDDRKASVEAGLMVMLDRIQAGRLKVFSNLNDWMDEFRQYHRKDGKVVKERDDLMDATRYAIMMLRYAKVIKPRRNYVRGRRIGGPRPVMAG